MAKKIIITDGQYQMLRLVESTDSFIGDYRKYMGENIKKLNSIYGKISFLSLSDILSGDISKEEISGYKKHIESIEGFCYDLYKRAIKAINSLSDEEYDTYGQKVEEIVNDVYYSNKDKIAGLRLMLKNIGELIKMNKKSEIHKAFADSKPIEV